MKGQSHRASAIERDLMLPLALVTLSAVPVVAGIARLNFIATGAAPTLEDTRFLTSPIPIALHIVAASCFSLLGAFQFSPGLRGRSHWHRIIGRMLIPLGLLTALSGIWMTLFYPAIPIDSFALFCMRLVFGTAMVGSILLASAALIRRDFRSHGDWMIRGYAIALGAGTQVLTHLPWFLLVGSTGATSRTILMGAGWIINLVVAEWAIARMHRAASEQLHTT